MGIKEQQIHSCMGVYFFCIFFSFFSFFCHIKRATIFWSKKLILGLAERFCFFRKKGVGLCGTKRENSDKEKKCHPDFDTFLLHLYRYHTGPVQDESEKGA